MLYILPVQFIGISYAQSNNTFSPQICVNDDLVAKKFAYYSRKSADSSRLDEEDRFLLRLSPGILMQTVSATTIKPTSQIQPPPGKHPVNTLPVPVVAFSSIVM